MRTLSLPLALLTVLPAAACLDHDGGNDTQAVSSALEQANGGLTTSDEPPEFGAEADFSAAAIENDNAASDPIDTSPTAATMDRASAAAGFRMVVVWGKIPADRDATEARDWSGSLKVSRGGLIVRHTIAFEERTDKLLPRVSLDTVSFQSVTRPFVDGLALTVLDPTATPTASAQTLTYTSADGGTVYTMDLSQLAAGPIVIDAGNGFKMIAIAHHRQAAECDRGFMRGRWHALTAHLGRFLGVVTDENGERVGHVRGIFGQRRNGDSVIFGKFIDREGHFRGILAGTFADGQYRARWITRDGEHGTAHGAYFEGATADAGHFLGRWADSTCSADTAPPTTTPPAPGT
ncbi:MAG: hypothetical protein E6J90_35270 [Deltaproteobacteria bacterium]|nr:MAG: hypothetical protein E6J90_35270 [Deltaproteobacteria bacterium]